MWPMLLDMTEEESSQLLRHLELKAYSSLVSALRAQGPLNAEKQRILKEISSILNISNDRHKAEVRRAINDEKLNTIAYHITGRLNSLEDWANESRRLVPLLPRQSSQSSYIVLADEISDTVTQANKQLPLPADTERKRKSQNINSLNPPMISTDAPTRLTTFRVPEVPKDEPKKRKFDVSSESSSLFEHLLSPKLSKIQQIYRQTTKMEKLKTKTQSLELETIDSKIKTNDEVQVSNNVYDNSIQNIGVSQEIPRLVTESIDENSSNFPVHEQNNLQDTPLQTITQEPPINVDSSNEEQTVDSSIGITKIVNKGQKLIVVSSSQTLPTGNILQKNSFPLNKFTKLNLDNFKILPKTHLHSALPVTSGIQNTIPKLLTIKGNKRIIPLSQLQVINSDGKIMQYANKLTDKIVSIKPSQIDIRETNCLIPKKYLDIQTNSSSLDGMGDMLQKGLPGQIDIKEPINHTQKNYEHDLR